MSPFSSFSHKRSSFELPGFRSRPRHSTAATDVAVTRPHDVRIARREFEEKERAKAEKERIKAERKRGRADSKELKSSTKTMSPGSGSSGSDMRGSGATSASGHHHTSTTPTTITTAVTTATSTGAKLSEKFFFRRNRNSPASTPTSAGGAKFETPAEAANTGGYRASPSVRRRTKAAWIAFVLWLRTRLLKLQFKARRR
jgi:hypothetical protein